jgi:hypothetical protein
MFGALKLLIIRVVQKMGHTAEHFCHMAYLGLVGFEAHGSYRYAAIALLLVVVVNLMVDSE